MPRIPVYDVLNAQVKDFQSYGTQLFQKSIDILSLSQLPTGGTTASLPGTRYAGHVYPRDHGYATRAFLAANDFDRAEKALEYILTCELDASGVMFQRYDESGKNASYKPPQIDGNAQTLLSLAIFCKRSKDILLLKKHKKHIAKLLEGINKKTNHFPKGSLVHSINGIIEYSAFEEGYELYTNAVCYRALKAMAELSESHKLDMTRELDSFAEKLHKGIDYYLYYPSEQTFIPCLRTEPDVSYVLLANLKSFLALTDFTVYPADHEKIQTSLAYHLSHTRNEDLGGFNRYHYLMDRHNFGNGPWPMVMLRLAQYYMQANDKAHAKECLNWVLNAAKNNLDVAMTLPEHIATKESFEIEYEAFKKLNDTAPRPAKAKEYEVITKSKTYKELGLAYAINPLTWSHAQFILAWSDWKDFAEAS